MRPEIRDGLVKAVYWISDKIVSGLVAFIKLIPPADRRLTDWTTRLLQLMLRHRAISLVILILIPTIMFILDEDGLLEPISDALDMFTELVSNLPFDLLLLVFLPGMALAISLIMFRKQLGFGAACRLVFYAVLARLIYLAALAVIIMFLLQLTPLTADRRGRLPGAAIETADLAKLPNATGEWWRRSGLNLT
jgi:hypothetical protein